MYEITLVVMSSYLAYLVAEVLGFSGIVALFFTGACCAAPPSATLSFLSSIEHFIVWVGPLGSLSRLRHACGLLDSFILPAHAAKPPYHIAKRRVSCQGLRWRQYV